MTIRERDSISYLSDAIDAMSRTLESNDLKLIENGDAIIGEYGYGLRALLEQRKSVYLTRLELKQRLLEHAASFRSNLPDVIHDEFEGIKPQKWTGREESAKTKGKYVDFWKGIVPDIKKVVSDQELNNEVFLPVSEAGIRACGNRKRYAFRLVLKDGKVANNVSSSAVARDLNEALSAPESSETMALLASGTFVFRFDKEFRLWLSRG